MSISASAACITCRKQKKKCDRKLPRCSRCLFALKNCKYEDKAAMPVVRTGYKIPAIDGDILSHPHLLLNCPEIDYYIQYGELMHHDTAELHAATINYVLKLLSSSEVSIERMLNEYLRTIGTWLPVISRKRLYESVSSILEKPRADFALLLLSIYLVLQPPTRHFEGLPSTSPAYSGLKQLLCLLESADFKSINMVQSALLITIYEYGRGSLQSAFLSIGTCSRMAHLLGWQKKRVSLDDAGLEEELRVWWGIRAVERLLDLNPNFSPSILTPDNNIGLPTENEDWDLPPGDISTESPRPQTALLQAQGARLLGKAISFTTSSPLSIEERSQYDNELKSTLVQFAIAVSDSSREEWGANCGALGLAYSAIYHLHLTPCTENNDAEDKSSIFELHRTTRIIIDIARTFQLWCLSYKNEANPSRCLPLTLHALHQACLTHIELAGADFQSPEWEDDLEVLKEMLMFIRRRWALAGKVLDDVQEAYDRKVRSQSLGRENLPR